MALLLIFLKCLTNLKMLKDFLMKKMLASKLKDMPAEERDKMVAIIEKNPELFQKVALEVQEKIKQGQNQMTATMAVVKKYQEELKNIV